MEKAPRPLQSSVRISTIKNESRAAVFFERAFLLSVQSGMRRHFLFFVFLGAAASSTSGFDPTDFPLPYYAPKSDTSIADAVVQFNARASLDPVGKTQSPLTSDEVVAAIRGKIVDETIRDTLPISIYRTLRKQEFFPKAAFSICIHGGLDTTATTTRFGGST